jgi:hypothetical protein
MHSMTDEGRTTRRAPTSKGRRLGRSSRPSVEVMEGRQLLSTVPVMYSNSASATEHGTAPVPVNFTVLLTTPSSQPVTVNYQTSDATGKSGVDYTAAGGTLTFAPGQTKATITVTALPNLAATSNKAFSLNLSGAQGATLATSKLTGTIVEQNTPPPGSLSINSQQMTVGHVGAGATMIFTVSLNAAQLVPITVKATTSDLTALAGTNYVATSQVLTFAPGQTKAQFSVTIFGSTKAATDMFLVTLTSGSVAIGSSQGAGTIIY